MENQFIIDRELLKQQRKQRKKEKKEVKKLEKQKEQERNVQKQLTYTKVCVIKNQENVVTKTDVEKTLKLNDKGEGLNRHVKSKAAIQVSLQSLQKTKDAAVRKCENKRCEVFRYLGNPLDSSHPERFKGKHREEPRAKKLSRLKLDILEDERSRTNDGSKDVHLIEYCNNLLTEELNNTTKEYIRKLVQLQDNAFLKGPTKAKIKKRYILGFHELKKKLIVGKMKFFIIAADIKIYNKEESLYKIIEEIVSIAECKSCSYVFALKRSKLGNLSKVYRPVSCFGVLNHQGAEEEYKKILKEIHKVSSENGQDDGNSYINEAILETFKAILIEKDDKGNYNKAAI